MCAFLINILIQKKKFFRNQKYKNNEKIIIVLDRSIGHRDVEIIRKSSSTCPPILYLRRSITKLIFFFFLYKKKHLFNYLKPPIKQQDYFRQKKNYRRKHQIFWSSVILNLKTYYKNSLLNFVTFNFTYFSEYALYYGCSENNVPVKLWYKEGIKTVHEAKYEAKFSKFKNEINFFYKISVYNEMVKKMFINIAKSLKNKNLIEDKLSVNGCPRIYDYINKKKKKKKIKNLLFLSFDSKRGIPRYSKNKILNWNLTYDKVIKILNEISQNKDINITIKRKNNSTYHTKEKINKNIKIYSNGTAKEYINKADIIIGHNSASTIEALINGKIVMVPFFEVNKNLKKYLYRFNKEIIYTSEKKMKSKIINLINKKISFPTENKNHQNTIKYYFGSSKNIYKDYLNFLNS